MKLFLVVLLACAIGHNAATPETFRGRINARGTNTIEAMMRGMIVKVNDLLKKNVRLGRMQLGPVAVEGFNIRKLNTHEVDIIMAGNKLGLRLRNGAVHLTANLVVYIGPLRIAKQFDTYGDGIYAYLDSGIGVKSGHLHAHGMNCKLTVARPRVDLHCHLINNFANRILQGVMPKVTQGVCEGVKKFGTGMANSIFQAIPTNINVFNMFRLQFPVVNFRTWHRHLIAGIGMEVRPLNNKQQSNKGLRLLKLPEAEDGHMVCGTLSDYVVNTATRTFLPPGSSFQLDVASVLNMLVKDLFKFAIFVKGTITESPLLLIENGEFKLSMTTKGVMTDKDGVEIAGTQIKPTTVEVRCPTKATPLFSKVKVVFSGAFNMVLDVNIANIIDKIISLIDQKASQYGRMAKRATETNITNVLNKMFFTKWFYGFKIRMEAKHGALIMCMTGNPNSRTTNKIYGLLRGSFNRG